MKLHYGVMRTIVGQDTFVKADVSDGEGAESPEVKYGTQYRNQNPSIFTSKIVSNGFSMIHNRRRCKIIPHQRTPLLKST